MMKRLLQHIKNIPLPPVFLAGAILTSVMLDRILPIVTIIQFPLNLSGLAVAGVGLYLVIKSLRLLKSYRTTTCPTERPTALIKDFPYSLSRNPIYLGYFLIAFGVAVFLGSLSAFVAPLLLIFIINKKVVPFEEKMLQDNFGSAYQNYKKRVGRWL